MVAVQPRPVDPVIFSLDMSYRLPVHAEVRFARHQSLFVIFPRDHRRSAARQRYRLPAAEIHEPNCLVLLVVLLPEFILSIIQRYRVSIRSVIPLLDVVQPLVKLTLHSAVRVRYRHRLSVHIKPGYACRVLAVQPCPVNPVIFFLDMSHRLSIHAEVRFARHQPLLVIFPRDRRRSAARRKNWLPIQSIITLLKHPALHRIDSAQAAIPHLLDHRFPIGPVISLLIHIAVLIIFPLQESILIHTVHQLILQIPISNRYNKAFLIIGVLNGAIPILVCNSVFLLVQVDRPKYAAFFVYRADLSSISVHGHQLLIRIIITQGIFRAFFIIFCLLISINLARCQNQLSVFIIIPNRGRFPIGLILRSFRGIAVLAHDRLVLCSKES